MSSGQVAAAVARASPGSDSPPKPAGRRPRPRPDRGRRGGRPPERRRTRADHKRFHRKRRGGGAQESLWCSPPPRGGGLGAPGSRWRGTVAGEGRSGEERSSRRDGPEEDRPDDELLGPPAIEDRHDEVRHEEAEGDQGDRPEARRHVSQRRSEDSEGHEGGHRPEDERQEREDGVDQFVRVGRRDEAEAEGADPRYGDGDREAATSEATKEERGGRRVQAFRYLGALRSEAARARLEEALDAYLERLTAELRRRRGEILARALPP